MSWLDYAVTAALVAALTGAFVWRGRRRKKGKACCGECASCRKCS